MEFDRKHPKEFFDALKPDCDQPPANENPPRELHSCECDEGFMDSLGLNDIMDQARAMESSFGLRPYRVFSVVYRETETGEEVVSEEEYLPRPVVDLDGIKLEATDAGTKETGDVKISELSPAYSEDQIRALYPTRLPKGMRAYYEVVLDARDTAPRRRRFALSTVPQRDAFGWTVKASVQRLPRDRDTAQPPKAKHYPERMRA